MALLLGSTGKTVKQGRVIMRKILSAASMAAALALSGSAWAENYYGSQFDAPGGTEGHFGSGMSQPMVVDAGTGILRERPNVQSKILTTLGRVHRGRVVSGPGGVAARR
jgi:hypothetical protein